MDLIEIYLLVSIIVCMVMIAVNAAVFVSLIYEKKEKEMLNLQLDEMEDKFDALSAEYYDLVMEKVEKS